MVTGKPLFDQVALQCSRMTTKRYSTSFSLGIRLLNPELRDPIYSIYGFVRFADEIVDTFHDYNKEELFNRFEEDTWKSIEDGISLNPILNSFQHVVRKYDVDHELITTFLHSMRMDLDQASYDREGFEEYVLGSAEVVGLMCLTVFTKGDKEVYNALKPQAMRLGAAFQKINFLRDLKADYQELGRSYFPGVDFTRFTEADKRRMEEEIAEDFHQGYLGIQQLPRTSRFGVYLAYRYYMKLFKKIRNTPSETIMETRVRVPNRRKMTILFNSFLRHSLNML